VTQQATWWIVILCAKHV